MSRRPKFWMHRSRRFWWGLLILLMLQGAWIYASFSGAMMGYREPSGSKSGALAVELGGVRFSRVHYSRTTPGSTIEWYFDAYGLRGMKLEPEFNRADFRSGGYRLSMFLPGWIPVLIWVLWWPLWMRRGDKAEDAIAAQTEEISSAIP